MKEFHSDTGMVLSFTSSGRQRAVAPSPLEEISRIAQEAIQNAVRHSAARHVQVKVTWSWFRLTLQVQDDGCGMDAGTLRYGRESHWGLTGMRERAQKIHGRLTIESASAGGTHVTLTAPASSIYCRRHKPIKPDPDPPGSDLADEM